MNLKTLNKLADQATGFERYPNAMFPPSPYYRFLRLLAAEMKPRLSVELGVCGGGGSLHLAVGYPDGKVIGVDWQYDHPESVGYVEENYKNFYFWIGDSIKAAPKIMNKHGKIDILFIDTTHTYDDTIAEYNAYKPYLSDKAVVCFDDLNREQMKGFWDWLDGNKVRYDFLNYGNGWGVIWKEERKCKRC